MTSHVLFEKSGGFAPLLLLIESQGKVEFSFRISRLEPQCLAQMRLSFGQTASLEQQNAEIVVSNRQCWIYLQGAVVVFNRRIELAEGMVYPGQVVVSDC